MIWSRLAGIWLIACVSMGIGGLPKHNTGMSPGQPCGPITCWNPLDKSAGVVLGNGFLTASDAVYNVTDLGVRANIGKTTGKWYMEFPKGSTMSAGRNSIGIALLSAVFSGTHCVDCDATGAYVMNKDGACSFNGASQACGCGSVGAVPGNGMGMAVDLGNKKIWWLFLGTGGAAGLWCGDGTANNTNNVPSTNTGGADISAIFPGAGAFPYAGMFNIGDNMTANFQGPFTGAPIGGGSIPPTGFSPWQ